MEEDALKYLPLFYRTNLLFMMIGLPIEYGHSPIELLDEDEAYHLVGESHSGK
jgi:hypothetical protein